MSTIAIRPLNDRVLVERHEAAEKTPGGIVIPDDVKERPLRGKVIAVGEGAILENGEIRRLGVRLGDEVLFAKFAGTEVDLGNGHGEGKHLLLREEDILGIVEAAQ